MLRRTILIAAGAALLLVGAVGASGRATDQFTGTWTVTPAPGTPWANGGTLTIRSSSRSEVEGLDKPGSRLKVFCTGDSSLPPSTAPVPTAWYVATYSWSGGGTLGGCIAHEHDFPNNGCPRAPCFLGANGLTFYVLQVVNRVLSGDWEAQGGGGIVLQATQKEQEGTTKTVSGLAPGGSTFTDSPAVPAALDCRGTPPPKGCGVYIDDQPGGQDPRGTVIAAEGDFERSPTPGEFVFWCWLSYDFTNSAGTVVQLSARDQLLLCIGMTRYLLERGKFGKPKPPAVVLAKGEPAAAPAAGCRVKAIPISFRKRGIKAVALGRAKKAKLTSSSVRYSCTRSGGATTIGISAPRGLRTAVGKQLNLMVARAKNAHGRGPKLSMTFGW